MNRSTVFWSRLKMKPAERTRRGRDPLERLIKGLVGQDRQDRPENLVLHDLVIPGDGIKKRGIEVVRFWI